MRSSIQEKPIKKARIEAELYKVCSSIHLSNVTDHYSEEYMKLYFESKRSGGGTKAVKSVELMGNGEAVVSFESRLGIIYLHVHMWVRNRSMQLGSIICNSLMTPVTVHGVA